MKKIVCVTLTTIMILLLLTGCLVLSAQSIAPFGLSLGVLLGTLFTVCAAGSPSVTVSTNFEDLDVGSYYYSAVVWANVNGIVNGTSDTTFSPDSRLTRQQLAAILYRYARAFGGDTSYIGNLSHFTDRHQVDSYATTPMIWAVSHEIISGTSDTTLSPLSTATRAQVVVILHRYLTD